MLSNYCSHNYIVSTYMTPQSEGNQTRRFRSVAVITCASHAQGPRFEPGRKQTFFSN